MHGQQNIKKYINILSVRGLQILWAGSSLSWTLFSTQVDHCSVHAPSSKMSKTNALDLRVNLIIL